MSVVFKWQQSKRRRVSLPASTTKSTSSNETKTFMTSNYIAKLVFNSHLHKIKQANERKSCQEPAAISKPIEPSLSTASIFCLSKACKYFPVVPMSLCPMSADTVLIFAPVSSIFTAKE